MHVKHKAGETSLPAVEVAVPLPVYQTFTYGVPASLLDGIKPGVRVLVSFGKRRLGGYVLGPSGADVRTEIKPIEAVMDPDPFFPSDMVPFFKWISDYYLHPIGEVISCALPPGTNVRDLGLISITDIGRQAMASGKADSAYLRVLELLEKGPLKRNTLKRALGNSMRESLLARMETKNWIQKERVLQKPTVGSKVERYAALAKFPEFPSKFSEATQRILSTLKDRGEMPIQDLNEDIPNASRLLASLQKKGWVRVFTRTAYRDPFGEPVLPDRARLLTAPQVASVDAVLASLGRGYRTFLLAGVTGSGKTEVYLHLAEKILQRKESALIMIPEIALISQMERRFRARFGNQIAVLHSGLSRGERYDQWNRILNQEAGLVIGARSAIFAPLRNIGLIIVDEEHDPSFKQEQGLRYHARDLAVLRAMMGKTIALLGSATPSIQSHYNVRTRKFTGLELPQRIEARPLPAVTVVDLKETRHRRGTRRFLTDALVDAMKETLEKKEQILLFLNRRGFAGFPLCIACGNPVICRRCDISMTYHKGDNIHSCHYCGDIRPAGDPCRWCGSLNIKNMGLGTEKLEAAVKALFPKFTVTRMDRDTTRQKGSLVSLLKGLKTGTTDILIGTQIVAKGHDFPNITLVGIICADLSLNFPDFRASERTFQILAQVAGRAGRGDQPGRVILQTFNPNHFSILAARDQDFKKFFNQEIRFRKALNYPPFSHIIALKVSGVDKEATRKWALSLGAECHGHQQARKDRRHPITILGPLEAPLTRIAGKYRWQILLKCRHIGALKSFVSELRIHDHKNRPPSGIQVVVDVDPYDMM